MTCPDCQREIQIGDYPFCKGQQSDHVTEQSHGRGLFSQPIYLDQSLTNSQQFSYPGYSDDPVPEGYRRIEIRNMREADHWTKQINAGESAKQRAEMECQQHYAIEQDRERRERIDNAMKQNGMDRSGRARWLRDMARQLHDRRQSEHYSKRGPTEVNIRVIARDSSRVGDYVDRNGDRHRA